MPPSSSPTKHALKSQAAPTANPFMQSAHHFLDGSLHALKHTLSQADTARFYPTGMTGHVHTISRSQQETQPAASPATSSFTSGSNSGSSRSRMASVHAMNTDNYRRPQVQHMNSRGAFSNGYKQKKKRANRVGRVKVSIGDAAQNLWRHIVHRVEETRGRGVKKQLAGVDVKKGDWRRLGLPPAVKESSREEKEVVVEEEVEEEEKPAPIIQMERCIQPEMLKVPPIQSTNSATAIPAPNNPSVPLYPLLFILTTYLILKHLFSYRNRTRVSRHLQLIMGSKQFYVSQQQLEEHIAHLAERNKRRTAMGLPKSRGFDGDFAGGSPERKRELIRDVDKSKGMDDTLNSILMTALSESTVLLTDEKEELIQQRRLLLHDRGKRLILKLLSEKVDECQKVLWANQKLTERTKLMESECAEIKTCRKKLVDGLDLATKEKAKLKQSLDGKKKLVADLTASVNEMKESLKQSEAEVEQLTNENIILNNVIGRLEEENNEMEKVIEDACRSGTEDMDIREIDVAVVSSGVSVAESETLAGESLTKDEEDDEIAKLQEEKEVLQKAVEELKRSLSLQSEMDRGDRECAPQARESKVDELQHLLDDKQEDLDKLSSENEEIISKLGQIQKERDELKSRQMSSLQQANKLSWMKAWGEDLQNMLDEKQSDLDKLSSENQEVTSKLARMQKEYNELKNRQTTSLQQAKQLSWMEAWGEELQKMLKSAQSDLEKKSCETKEITCNLTRLQNERDALQQQLAVIKEENDEHTVVESLQKQNNQLQESLSDLQVLYNSLLSSLELRDEKNNAAVESLQNKNKQLQQSLANLESLYTSLCSEKKNLQQSLDESSARFNTLQSEKKAVQSSLLRERKRITRCNKLLQDASKTVLTLIIKLQAEIKRAQGTVSDVTKTPKLELSDGASESKVMLHHAEVLQKQLLDLKHTNQQLVVAFQRLTQDSGLDGNTSCDDMGFDEKKCKLNPLHDKKGDGKKSSLSISTEHIEEAVGAADDHNCNDNITPKMFNRSKSTGDAKDTIAGDVDRLRRTLDGTNVSQSQRLRRDKSSSPTNRSFTRMKSLWRKKSSLER